MRFIFYGCKTRFSAAQRTARRRSETGARTAQKRKGSTHGVRKTARAKPLASLARQIRPNERHAGGEQQKQQRMARLHFIYE